MTLTYRVALGCILGILALTYFMLRSVLVPAALGALFATLLHPVHAWLHARLGRARGASAPLVVVASTVLVLVPVVLIGLGALQHLRELLGEGFSEKWASLQKSLDTQMERLHRLGGSVGIDITPSNITDNVAGILKSVAHQLGEGAAATPAMLLSTFIFLLAMYFFVRDGAACMRYLTRISPFQPKHTGSLVKSMHDAVYGVVLASIVSGLVQSALILLSQWILGVPGVLLWTVSGFLLSFLPMVGTTPITLGSTLYLFIVGHPGAGVAMGIAAFIIGISDNFVRPVVQGTRSAMHPMLTLLAIFGGLELFGAAGVFLGPVLAAMALWCFNIYEDDISLLAGRELDDKG